jgi:hypothetical protein
MPSVRKRLIGIVFALTLALTTFTSSALAHECIIISRSDMGDLKATSSGQWINVDTRVAAFGFLGQLLGLQALSQSQLAWADAQAAAAGVPNDLVIFAKFTIAGGSAADGTALMSNGRGVDHLFDVLVPIYMAALQQPAT